MLAHNVMGDLSVFFAAKPSWSKKEIIEKVAPYVASLTMNPMTKIRIVREVRKYDVLYMNTIGMMHYVLVHRVEGDLVHGVVISSKDRAHSIMSLNEDRFFEGSYITSTYLTYDLSECLGAFSRIYESKKEANRVFTALKRFYKVRMKG